MISMNEAQTYYESMSKNYGMIPTVEHHTCIVVVFACSGDFEKAMSIIRTLPSSDHPQVWIALLNACTRWGNVSLGKTAFDQAMQLDSNLSAPYVIMANMYAVAGMGEKANEIEAMRIKHAAWKKFASNLWIDTSKDFCLPSTRDSNDSQREDINASRDIALEASHKGYCIGKCLLP